MNKRIIIKGDEYSVYSKSSVPAEKVLIELFKSKIDIIWPEMGRNGIFTIYYNTENDAEENFDILSDLLEDADVKTIAISDYGAPHAWNAERRDYDN